MAQEGTVRRVLIAIGLVVATLTVFAPPSSAAVFSAPTNLTIHVRGSAVFGKLVGPPQCRNNQRIHLWVNGTHVRSTLTDSGGNYLFQTSLTSGDEVQTIFLGSREGNHPDRSNCAPSASRVVTVKEHGHNGEGDGDGDDDHGHHGDGDDDEVDSVAGALALRLAEIGL
jgi:hypothetical protein